MNISEQLPDPGEQSPFRSRRRRSLLPSDSDSLSAWLVSAFQPTFDFFWITILAAVFLTSAIIFNTPGLLVLGAILCVNAVPFAGIGFALSAKSMGEVGRNLAAIGVILFAAIVIGFGGAWIAQRFVVNGSVASLPTVNGLRFQWDMILLLILGMASCTYFAAKKSEIARLGLIAVGFVHIHLATQLGFIMFAGQWQQALDQLILILFSLVCSILINVTLIHVFKIVSVETYILGGVFIVFLMLILLIFLARIPSVESQTSVLKTPTAQISPTIITTHNPSPTEKVTTSVSMATATPLLTPTATLTPAPQIMVVQAEGQRGARLRKTAGLDGIVIDVLINGTSVTVLGPEITQDDYRWLNIITKDGKIGWIVDSALIFPQETTSTVVPPTATRTN